MMPALTVTIILIMLEDLYSQCRAFSILVSPRSVTVLLSQKAISPLGNGWMLGAFWEIRVSPFYGSCFSFSISVFAL